MCVCVCGIDTDKRIVRPILSIAIRFSFRSRFPGPVEESIISAVVEIVSGEELVEMLADKLALSRFVVWCVGVADVVR